MPDSENGEFTLAEQPAIVEFTEFDRERVVEDRSAIERSIPQRFEMAQLDGILFVDEKGMRAVGFKDTGPDEFWVRGHMPEFALMPGVIMCETAAQLIAWMAARFDCSDRGIMAFGGLNNVRFRNVVLPGDRLVVMAKVRRLRRNTMVICDFQGYVEKKLVVDGEIKGVVIEPGSSA